MRIKILSVLQKGIITFILIFIGLEVIIRLTNPQMVGPIQYAYHPQLRSIPVPNQKGRRILPGVYDYRYANNSYGLRGEKEYTFDKKVNFRILFLGDSFTYGIGVDDELTFVSLIEQKLLEEGYSVEAINAGNGGKGTDYALRFFEVLGRKFHPDLTVLCFHPTDFGDNARGDFYSIDSKGELHPKSHSRSIAAQKSFLKYIPFYNWFISWSHTANLLKKFVIKLILKKAKTEKQAANLGVITYKKKERQYYTDAYDDSFTKIYFRELREKVRESKSGLIVIYIPDKIEVDELRRLDKISKDESKIRTIVEDENVKFISLLPYFGKTDDPINTLYYREGHWTAKAHLLAAKILIPYIREKIKYR